MICTPNTGHPVLGVFLCDIVTSTRRSALNCTDKGNEHKVPRGTGANFRRIARVQKHEAIRSMHKIQTQLRGYVA